MTKLGEADKRVLEEILWRQNFAAPPLIRGFLGLSSVRPMTGAWAPAVFFESAAKDPGTAKQKSDG
jgi:hypothetical protein